MQDKHARLGGNLLKATVAAAALLNGAAPASAQSMAQDEVAVAIIDTGVRKIDFDDPNVRFVDMTPQPPAGSTYVNEKHTDAYSHGDIVASSFVREYRKLDDRTPIVIYTCDPFIKNAGSDAINFNIKGLSECLAKMKQANVKIAITAFGLEDPSAGKRIADLFNKNGMAMFAAIPNERNDRGIYPAATPGVISVADTSPNGALAGNRSYGNWVTLQIAGHHGSSHNTSDASGTSFAVAHAGAYGAYILRARPDIAPEQLGDIIAGQGRKMDGVIGGKPLVTSKIGGEEMIARITKAYPIQSSVRFAAKGPAASSDHLPVAVEMAAAGR